MHLHYCVISSSGLAAQGQERREHTVGCIMSWDGMGCWQRHSRKTRGAKETRELVHDWLEQETRAAGRQ